MTHEKNKFIGCILQLKTKPDETEVVKNIIGTVQDILENKNIVLDEAICNGRVVDGKVIVGPEEIADLQVIGRVESTIEEIAAEPQKKLNVPVKIAKPLPRRAVNPVVLDGKQGKQINKETFQEISLKELKEEFDFEKSNQLFEKLPTAIPLKKPQQLKSAPVVNFTSNDTTFERERQVPSCVLLDLNDKLKIKSNDPGEIVGDGGSCGEFFTTDTGIIVPAVELGVRSAILNDAGRAGLLGHERMIETMSRAIVQTLLPLFCESWRLSPEVTRAPPTCLILAGPHWHGAVAIGSARLLQNLGLHTIVFSPKEEISICKTEERLYKLSGGVVIRNIVDLKPQLKKCQCPPSLLLSGMDDHLSQLTIGNYKNHLDGDTLIALIDPPLSPSFKLINSRSPVMIFCPSFPLKYKKSMAIANAINTNSNPGRKEGGVKFFCVNLGIPDGIFKRNGIDYKSFYGGRCVVAIF